MFDMIGAAPICVQVDQEVQDSICEWHNLPDNLCQTVINLTKTPVVRARLYAHQGCIYLIKNTEKNTKIVKHYCNF